MHRHHWHNLIYFNFHGPVRKILPVRLCILRFTTARKDPQQIQAPDQLTAIRIVLTEYLQRRCHSQL